MSIYLFVIINWCRRLLIHDSNNRSMIWWYLIVMLFFIRHFYLPIFKKNYHLYIRLRGFTLSHYSVKILWWIFFTEIILLPSYFVLCENLQFSSYFLSSNESVKIDPTTEKNHTTFIILGYHIIMTGWFPANVELSYDEGWLRNRRDWWVTATCLFDIST